MQQQQTPVTQEFNVSFALVLEDGPQTILPNVSASALAWSTEDVVDSEEDDGFLLPPDADDEDVDSDEDESVDDEDEDEDADAVVDTDDNGVFDLRFNVTTEGLNDLRFVRAKWQDTELQITVDYKVNGKVVLSRVFDSDTNFMFELESGVQVKLNLEANLLFDVYGARTIF